MVFNKISENVQRCLTSQHLLYHKTVHFSCVHFCLYLFLNVIVVVPRALQKKISVHKELRLKQELLLHLSLCLVKRQIWGCSMQRARATVLMQLEPLDGAGPGQPESLQE